MNIANPTVVAITIPVLNPLDNFFAISLYLSIGTVFIGYVGIGLIGNETEFKEDRLRVIIFTILVILSSYMGYAMVDMLV
jgi:hypothetical protein